MEAVINSMVRIPLSLVGQNLEAIKAELTITPVDFGTYGPAPSPIESFVIDRDTLSVPVQWGINFCLSNGIPIRKEFCDGVPITTPRLPDPFHPKAPKGQKAFFDAVIAAATPACVVLACSPTGTGKTATGLNFIAHWGRAAIVIVHSKEIARQWREVEIPKHLGLTPDEVGIVEETVCDFVGKKIVVAVIHNIIQKKFSREFYEYFGTVIWDEGHKLGAPAFNESTRYFAARKKLVLTATPHRKDGCMPLITNYFGQIRAASSTQPMDCMIQSVRYFHKKNYPIACPRARVISAIAMDEDRNKELATLIHAMFKAGRNFIGLSDRIEQLQAILRILHERGVPESQLALYTRSFVDGVGKTRETTPEELEYYRATSRIFLATYAMAKEGLDIPRLDSGMCLTPVADGVQAIGRITRILEGKPDPIWYIVKDENQRHLRGTYYAFIKSVEGLPHVKMLAK